MTLHSSVLLISVPHLEQLTSTVPAAVVVAAVVAAAVVLPPFGLALQSRQEAGASTPSSSNDEWRPAVPAAVLVPTLTTAEQVVEVPLPMMRCWAAPGVVTSRTGPIAEAE